MSKRYIIDRVQDYLIPFVFEITSFKTNLGTETITVNSDYSLSTSINGSGYANEQNSYIFSGKVPFNKATAIGTIKIEALASSFISKSPFLKSNFGNNIKLILSKVEKLTTGKLTKRTNIYTFNLYYRNKEATRLRNGLKAELIYSSSETGYRDSIIDNIRTGLEDFNNTVPIAGGASIIKIYGEPGSYFGLAVNQYPLDIEVKENGTTPTGRLISNKVDAVSILDDNTANSTTTFYGKELNIIKDKIGVSGVYKIPQNWPSVNGQNELRAAVSSSPDIYLQYSVDDVAVGDYVKIEGIRAKHKVLAIVDSSLKHVRLEASITAADDARVDFQRQFVYSVDVLSDFCSTLSSKIPVSRTFEINQYPDILISFLASTKTSDFTITHERIGRHSLDKTSGTGDVDDPMRVIDTSYVEYSSTPGENHTHGVFAPVLRKVAIEVLVRLKLVGNGGKTFSASRTPVFNNLLNPSITSPATPAAAQHDGGSDWTNSKYTENGGTSIIGWGGGVELSTASATNDTCELWYHFKIVRVGNRDVTLELDLDKILTATTP